MRINLETAMQLQARRSPVVDMACRSGAASARLHRWLFTVPDGLGRIKQSTRGLLVLVTLASACAPMASGGGTAPGTRTPGVNDVPIDRPVGRGEGDSRDELGGRLERQVEAYNVSLNLADSDPRACRDLCELSANICETRDKLCELADAQPSEDSYQDLCRRATRSCHDAHGSCLRCTEGFVPAHDQSPVPESVPATAVEQE